MDPDSFAMSSYQFVNSLASCYPQSQLAQQQQQQQQHSQHPGGNQSANDYFANPTYNPNLYSTPHYANQNYLATQQQQQPGASVADMVDYTQLQPQRMMLGGPQQTAQNPAQQAGAGHSTAAAANSCKYAGATAAGAESTTNLSAVGGTPTTAGPISSPQDLSTARELISPKLSPNSVVENVARNLGKGATNPQQMLANNNNNNNNKNINSNHTTNVSLHSPTGDSETSSDSGAEDGDTVGGGGGRSGRGNSSGSGGKKGSGPPEIYPWMKRVHLGQSEYFWLLVLFIGNPSLFNFVSQIGRTIVVFPENLNTVFPQITFSCLHW